MIKVANFWTFSDFLVDFPIFKNLAKITVIEYFDEYQKDSISGIMILQKFSKNDYIIREREQAVAVFILKEVRIIVIRKTKRKY